MTLAEFLLARIAEDEAAARSVKPLGHNFDMGGNRQDERFTFDRVLPSSEDGMGNWSENAHSPKTHAHFSRWLPERALAECGAKRRIIDEQFHIGYDMGTAYANYFLAVLALAYSDHPDYQADWKDLANR